MNRRTFLISTSTSLLAIPAFLFVEEVQKRPPKSVKVFKELNVGEHLVHDAFVLFETKDGPLAISRECTHLGCTVNYREAERRFLCPCHQSVFEWDGTYVKGPARKALRRFVARRLKPPLKGYEVLIPRSRLS